MTRLLTTLFYLFFLIAFVPACGDDVGNDDATASGENHDDHDDHGHDHDGHDHDPNEVMTTVILSFTPEGGGDAVQFSWADPEDDGSPVIDAINLTADETYSVSVQVLNELEDPAEDVTVELRDELDEHQFFFYGDAVSSPANENDDAIITQAYADQDANEFPVGLTNTITANEAGMGTLTIMLRHMPPVNGEAVKTGDLADLVKNGDIASLPGNVDIEISFDVTVQ